MVGIYVPENWVEPECMTWDILTKRTKREISAVGGEAGCDGD